MPVTLPIDVETDSLAVPGLKIPGGDQVGPAVPDVAKKNRARVRHFSLWVPDAPSFRETKSNVRYHPHEGLLPYRPV